MREGFLTTICFEPTEVEARVGGGARSAAGDAAAGEAEAEAFLTTICCCLMGATGPKERDFTVFVPSRSMTMFLLSATVFYAQFFLTPKQG